MLTKLREISLYQPFPWRIAHAYAVASIHSPLPCFTLAYTYYLSLLHPPLCSRSAKSSTSAALPYTARQPTGTTRCSKRCSTRRTLTWAKWTTKCAPPCTVRRKRRRKKESSQEGALRARTGRNRLIRNQFNLGVWCIAFFC